MQCTCDVCFLRRLNLLPYWPMMCPHRKIDCFLNGSLKHEITNWFCRCWKTVGVTELCSSKSVKHCFKRWKIGLCCAILILYVDRWVKTKMWLCFQILFGLVFYITDSYWWYLDSPWRRRKVAQVMCAKEPKILMLSSSFLFVLAKKCRCRWEFLRFIFILVKALNSWWPYLSLLWWAC